MPAAREYLERNHTALDLLRQAAARPQCRFEIDWQAAGRIPLPHLTQMRAAAKAVRVQAGVALLEGRAHHAVAGIGMLLHLSIALVDERWLISHIVRRAIRRMARDLARDVLRMTTTDLVDLDALDRAFSTPDPPESWARGLDGERAILVFGDPAEFDRK